ncbi:MAG TPA: tRNA (adenosine(37)-N6)-threonylcarbamoyltransferase complex dimerization subunit type 1 TsaB [Alphaproteobacteria bacterium]|jgi:tRNA threonylcarbamoyladenosine biosynthesis protein TsaB|nr:tRNA (adenosine(37)-N6)-threonylcarbamoyltransferase complex dimerization subunit type 1 TsaB [Alphaproteobacteria bacterium]
MMVLGLDSAAGACSAALWRDGAVVARRLALMERGHAEALMPMAQAAMAEAGAGFAALDGIGVTVGPGAFTGLRIGLAAARGLALAADIPAVGITTFEALAAAVPEAERAGRTLLAAVDSKRADVYVQLFDARLAPLTEPAALPVAEVAALLPPGPLLTVGDGVALLAPVLAGRPVAAAGAPPYPDAAWVAVLAARRLAVGRPAAPPAPLYLRPPDAIRPVHGGRLRP